MTVQIVRMDLKIYKQHQTTSGALLLKKLPDVKHPYKSGRVKPDTNHTRKHFQQLSGDALLWNM